MMDSHRPPGAGMARWSSGASSSAKSTAIRRSCNQESLDEDSSFISSAPFSAPERQFPPFRRRSWQRGTP
jgi:hypothetical protein